MQSGLVRGAVVACLCLMSAAGAAQQPDPTEPRDIGLVETTERGLVQLDVSVSGPREAIMTLTREDFELFVGGRKVDDFRVDSLCHVPAKGSVPAKGVPPAAESKAEQPAVAGVPAGSVTFLFYFDQHHLSMAGRQRSLDLSRELIPELIRGGNRGMIVSSGQELHSFTGLTEDPDELIEALGVLEKDRKQWDTFATEEDLRLQEVLSILSGQGGQSSDVTRAIQTARRHAADERWHTEKALRRFSMALGRLAEVDPPKAVLYFSDRMRSNAGEHYLGFFSSRDAAGARDSDLSAIASGAFVASNPFERVIQEAVALGIRLYTVQAEGLVASLPMIVGSMSAGGASDPGLSTRHIKDAQNSLAGLSLESGGEAFLNGVEAPRIARQIEEDLACVYLLSFDSVGLPEDQPVPVLVRTSKPKVKTQTRGQIVVQSASVRTTSRLLAAFTAPEMVQSEIAITSSVIPTGFADGKYSALVQIVVPPSLLAGTTWDLGLSLVSRGKVREDASGRLSVPAAGVPVVFEAEMTFRPGPYEIMAVAREVKGDTVGTAQITGSWPDPDEEAALVGPIVVLQPETAVFLRGQTVRKRGSLGISEGQLASTDRPTAIVGIVCRRSGGGSDGDLRVERRLAGDSAADFAPLQLADEQERCVQIRDLIPAGTMSTGAFDYEVHVLSGEEELATGTRTFAALAPGDDSLRAPAATD